VFSNPILRAPGGRGSTRHGKGAQDVIRYLPDKIRFFLKTI
jgi:hypothetical protein